MQPEIEAIMLAGAAAGERFAADSRAIDRGWRTGNLAELVDKLRKEAIENGDEHDGNSDAS